MPAESCERVRMCQKFGRQHEPPGWMTFCEVSLVQRRVSLSIVRLLSSPVVLETFCVTEILYCTTRTEIEG
jgi:hypothetical protein